MKSNHFIILVTVYNSEKWIDQCLDSATRQEYDNFHVILVDDCSTDNTGNIIKQYHYAGVTYHRNEVRAGDSLPNVVKALKLYSKDAQDIIIHLDGDDALFGTDVLSYLNKVYQDDIWITFGQFEPLSHKYHNYCTPIPDTKTYRKSGVWRTTHLKTHRRWLWDKIKDEDLRKPDGTYFGAAEDCAFMYPMIEMAGMRHHRFIDKILYLYNDLNQANYMKNNPKELEDVAAFIRNKPIYDEL